MSPLTKLFVVLLVVLSLLMTASVVVFVNRVEDYRATSQTSKDELAAAQRRADGSNTWTFKDNGPSEWEVDIRRLAFREGSLHYLDDGIKLDLRAKALPMLSMACECSPLRLLVMAR